MKIYEQAPTPEDSIEATEFITAVTEYKDDIVGLQSRYPTLKETYFHDQVPLHSKTYMHGQAPTDVTPTDSIPYSAKFGSRELNIQPVDLQSGMNVRVRGVFSVDASTDNTYTLQFRAGISGDSFTFGEIDAVTAQSFESFGPVLTEIDITLEGDPQVHCGCHSTYHAHFNSVYSMQEFGYDARDSLKENEMVVFDGEVIEYDAVNMLSPTTGSDALAFDKRSTQASTLGERKCSTIYVRTPNGDIIPVRDLYGYNNLYYRPTHLYSMPDYPLVGDTVRVAAQFNQDTFSKTAPALHYWQVQLQAPSAERLVQNQETEQKIDAAIAAIPLDNFVAAREAIAAVFVEATIVTEGHRYKLNLTDKQRIDLEQQIALAFWVNPEELPVSSLVLHNRFNLMYAAKEDADVFKLTLQELKDMIAQKINTTNGHDPNANMTYQLRLLEDVSTIPELTEFAARCWRDLQRQEIDTRAYEYRLDMITSMFNDDVSVNGARLLQEIALAEKTGPNEAVGYLRNILYRLVPNKDDVSDGDDIDFEAFGIYLDTYKALVSKEMTPRQKESFNFRVREVRENLGFAAMRFYEAARNQELLP